MSFNPLVSAWFAAQAPHIVRGLVVSEEDKSGSKGRIERMLSLWRARPAFLAYDVRGLPSVFADRARQRGLPLLAWTVQHGQSVVEGKSVSGRVALGGPRVITKKKRVAFKKYSDITT